MEKPSVSLLNAVNNAPFPTASDLHEDFVLAEPGQTFKVFVSLKRPSSITWPEGSTHLHVAGRLDGDFHMHSKFISRQNLVAFLAHAEDSPDEVQVILDGLLEQNIVYSKRRRPSFSKAVVQPEQWVGTLKKLIEPTGTFHCAAKFACISTKLWRPPPSLFCGLRNCC